MRITDQILGVKCLSLSLVLVTNVKNSQKFELTSLFTTRLKYIAPQKPSAK